jgi:hypothetical protein
MARILEITPRDNHVDFVSLEPSYSTQKILRAHDIAFAGILGWDTPGIFGRPWEYVECPKDSQDISRITKNDEGIHVCLGNPLEALATSWEPPAYPEDPSELSKSQYSGV